MLDFAPPPVLHSDALPSGTRLGEFELVCLLGVGGFGMVYQAYDHSLHRSVAIKEYMPTALSGRAGGQVVGIRSSRDGTSYQAGLQSFVAEARLLAQFDHPSLVKVFRFWEANNTAYMVMPLYSGMTLKQACEQMRRPPSEDWLRQVLWSVLQALQLLHGSHTVHRDVSPENIFLQDRGPPVLLDLGAARRAIGDLGPKHTAVLKVNYAPIEQYADVHDMAQGPWSDVYALAAVVYGCVTQALPMPATFRVLRDRMPSMQAVVQAGQGPTYSARFVDAIDQSLAIRPEERPQSVQDFVDVLDLQPPVDMAQFDWRTEMGLGWQWMPEERGQPAAVDLAELPTQFVYPPRPSVEATEKRPPRKPWVWAVLVLVVGMGAAVWMPPSEGQMRAQLSSSVPPVAAALSAQDIPIFAEVVAEPLASPVAHAPASVPAPQPRRARVAAKSPKPPRATPLASAQVLVCADSNFFTRPMCLHRECQKPALAELPVCVENTQRLLANQESRK
jgi:serine/threonine protein kinase